jgi:hypothetical protein
MSAAEDKAGNRADARSSAKTQTGIIRFPGDSPALEGSIAIPRSIFWANLCGLPKDFSINVSHIMKKTYENHHEKEGDFQPSKILWNCRLFDEPSQNRFQIIFSGEKDPLKPQTGSPGRSPAGAFP